MLRSTSCCCCHPPSWAQSSRYLGVRLGLPSLRFVAESIARVDTSIASTVGLVVSAFFAFSFAGALFLLALLVALPGAAFLILVPVALALVLFPLADQFLKEERVASSSRAMARRRAQDSTPVLESAPKTLQGSAWPKPPSSKCMGRPYVLYNSTLRRCRRKRA